MRDYTHVSTLLFNTPWAILPDKLEAMTEVLRLRLQGVTFTAEEIRARVGEAGQGGAEPWMSGSVAVLPLRGVIAQRANLITQASGGTSAEAFGKTFMEAMESDEVKAVVLDIDSPGGEVHGTAELANLIFEARGRKPVVAVANAQAASGAYFIGSQANEIVSIPTGLVGSIGVIARHHDMSKAEEMAGVTTTIIYAGKFKKEGNPHEPLSAAARQHAQEMVDGFYEMFIGAVARGRKVTAKAVRDGFGQGRMLGSEAALAEGMIDRVATLDEVIAQLGGGRPGGRTFAREAEERGQIAARREAEGTQEVQMDEKEIRAALGINEDADIVQAITGLQTEVSTLKTTLKADPDADVKTEVMRLRMELGDAQKRYITLDRETAQRVSVLEDQNRREKATAMVEAAVATGQLQPSLRDMGLKIALQDLKDFEEFVAGLPSVDLREHGIATDADIADLEPTATEMEAATQLGLTRKDVIRQKAKDQGITLPGAKGNAADKSA